MAIDPKKLEAFAGKGKPPKGDDAGDNLGEGDGHTEPDNEVGEDVGGIEKYVPLLQLLEEYQDDVEQCIDELDPETLLDVEADMAPEDQQIMKEGYESLDKRLKKELVKAADMGTEECTLIADHLYNEDKISDPEKLEGWLCRIAALLGGARPPAEAPEGGEGGGEEGEEEGEAAE